MEKGGKVRWTFSRGMKYGWYIVTIIMHVLRTAFSPVCVRYYTAESQRTKRYARVIFIGKTIVKLRLKVKFESSKRLHPDVYPVQYWIALCKMVGTLFLFIFFNYNNNSFVINIIITRMSSYYHYQTCMLHARVCRLFTTRSGILYCNHTRSHRILVWGVVSAVGYVRVWGCT